MSITLIFLSYISSFSLIIPLKILHSDNKMLQGNDAKPFKDDRGFTDRDINWIWNFNKLYQYHPYVQSSSILEKRKIVHNLFNNERDGAYFLERTLREKDNFLINEKDLAWIKTSSERMIIFTINTLIKMNNLYVFNLIQTNDRNYLIELIDSINLSKDLKINQINQIKSLWANFESKDKDIKWLNDKNIEQVSWAWDYLKKTNNLVFLPNQPTESLHRYFYVLASLDFMGFLKNSDAKQLFLNNMKKTWSQKKYRDSGKIKKPHHLPLTKNRHEQLKNLAEYFNKSIPDVLDFVIDKVYTECMTDAEGKPKKY
ncbi:hypothetical protein F896_00982 [Acinetobacter genomosp. 15BJ]|uniref:Uncharacterized protein n=2 Tax=Acinetobacter genomosp. 15BJ TaxID=106651 RepID=R9B5D9_9GAMM|nr:hypothetical protein F896_00982 [Acinetobacter genomosp. 15BJ]